MVPARFLLAEHIKDLNTGGAVPPYRISKKESQKPLFSDFFLPRLILIF